MAESPDYNPIEFTPFPSDPSQYVSAFNAFDVTTPQTHTIISLTDSKLYAVKQASCAGTMAGTYTSGTSTAFVYLYISRGVNNDNNETDLDGYQVILPAAASTNAITVVPYNIELPTPLVVRAGTVATPNTISVQIGTATSPATSRTVSRR